MCFMDYIQYKLIKQINKAKRRIDINASTILGYYNVLLQYQLYLMFACIWDKREHTLSRNQRIDYLKTMKRASLGTILNVIYKLDTMETPILGVNKKYCDLIQELITPRNKELAHGILIPGVQENSYQELVEKHENVHESLKKMNLAFFSEDCKFFSMIQSNSSQVIVFDNEDYDYQDYNEELIKSLDIQAGELYYYFGKNCYKISPFLILRVTPSSIDSPDIYCYQDYNLKNGMFNYKRYSELHDNVSFQEIYKDYFLSFQE